MTARNVMSKKALDSSSVMLHYMIGVTAPINSLTRTVGRSRLRGWFPAGRIQTREIDTAGW